MVERSAEQKARVPNRMQQLTVWHVMVGDQQLSLINPCCGGCSCMQVSHHIVVLLQDNTIASTCIAAAALLARPALDYVHLMTIVQVV